MPFDLNKYFDTVHSLLKFLFPSLFDDFEWKYTYLLNKYNWNLSKAKHLRFFHSNIISFSARKIDRNKIRFLTAIYNAKILHLSYFWGHSEHLTQVIILVVLYCFQCKIHIYISLYWKQTCLRGKSWDIFLFYEYRISKQNMLQGYFGTWYEYLTQRNFVFSCICLMFTLSLTNNWDAKMER